MSRIKDLMGLLLLLDDRKRPVVQKVFAGKRKVYRHREAILRALLKQDARQKGQLNWNKDGRCEGC